MLLRDGIFDCRGSWEECVSFCGISFSGWSLNEMNFG